jgi:hypothetical protein
MTESFLKDYQREDLIVQVFMILPKMILPKYHGSLGFIGLRNGGRIIDSRIILEDSDVKNSSFESS